MRDKIDTIKKWLNTGSINLFGLPMSGKDTQGLNLAKALNAKLLSSGLIIRAMEQETNDHYSDKGQLIPTNVFYKWVLPYFERQDLFEYPLILSSIGRWHGEEDAVINSASSAGHPIKAVIALNITKEEAEKRFEMAKILNDRGVREDDKNIEIFRTRLEEFYSKTTPVLQHYKDLGLLIDIDGNQDKEAVFNEIVDKLYEIAAKSLA